MRRMPLEDLQVPIRYRLSALWAATMLCYLYGDYFTLYKPGMLQALLDGQLEGMGPVSQGVLVAMAGIMTVPALMVALSLLLPATWARRANIVFGLAYSLYPYVVMDRLTIWQAASAPASLTVILIGSAITVPAIAGYTVFAYRVFWGKATALRYG